MYLELPQIHPFFFVAMKINRRFKVCSCCFLAVMHGNRKLQKSTCRTKGRFLGFHQQKKSLLQIQTSQSIHSLSSLLHYYQQNLESDPRSYSLDEESISQIKYTSFSIWLMIAKDLVLQLFMRLERENSSTNSSEKYCFDQTKEIRQEMQPLRLVSDMW